MLGRAPLRARKAGMEERLQDFASLLRRHGLRLSPAEVADAARALVELPLDDRGLVRAALRATLVKRGRDAETFDRLFDLYFGAAGRLLEGLEQTLAQGLSLDGLDDEEREQVLRELVAMSGASPIAGALAGGRLGDLARLLRAAALRVDFSQLAMPLQRGFYARRVLAQAGAPEAGRALAGLEARFQELGIDPAMVERFSEQLQASMKALEEAARRVAQDELAKRQQVAATGANALATRPIAALSPDELRRMREVVRALAEKLKSRLARRRRERRRGQLNVRRTLRRNLHLGGFPAKLSFRQKRPERPDVTVLCDVSDSVRNVSRLMLQFVYTLQSLYARVRSFVFVSDLGEVTALFKDAPPEEAVEGAIAAKVINLAANSNYGHALRTFHADFRGAVTRRTTLVVIGDGRGNYNPPNAWVLEDLRRRARRVVWLCPEDRSGWGWGDSEMYLYARHCDRVFTVKTVDDLARAAADLMP
jgi:hypothetical protein